MYLSFDNFSLTATYPFIHYSASVCGGDDWAIFFSQGVNVTFLYLFFSLYFQLYSKKPKQERKTKKDK